MTCLFNIGNINVCTQAEGPGRRLAIWFQGCNIGCSECCNIQFISIERKHVLSLEQLVAIINESSSSHGIEGVTYLGGEPTMQIELPQLTQAIHKMGLGVICFTGRKYEDVTDLLRGCDCVIDGPYISSRPEYHRRIIGSENQRIIHLTDRYKAQEEWFHADTIVGEINLADGIVYNGNILK